MYSRDPIAPANRPEHLPVSLELENGEVFRGFSFGADKPVAGELVFQTGMTGYPESLTDPSYEGQILVMTFPLVGNYGVPDQSALDEYKLLKYFESSRIHVAGLVVAGYTDDYSHYLAKSSLGEWLKAQNVPAIYAVDTRELTEMIRDGGSTLARLTPGSQEPLPFFNPNGANLVAQVSNQPERQFFPPAGVETIARLLVIDLGMKYNQIRCLASRGAELTVLPWNSDFDTRIEEFDALFLSNGPGDPATLTTVVEKVRKIISVGKKPVFGICLGHQVLSLAAGAKTLKLKFGNRGHNIPATNLITGQCHITSQNHGYAVDATTLTGPWKELFINANDMSNEGIYHSDLPIFSVQFHPESCPGPRDTEFLFDVFLQTVIRTKNGQIGPVPFVAKDKPVKVVTQKVLVLGSGGLSIGQAGEFDYSGSQAIKALKEEGIYTVLINPNIATIQTSKGLADKVYFLPVTPEFVRKVINLERPDAIYCTFGGQTALSVGIAMKDEFAGLGVKVLGTPIDTIITTEDRELFSAAMAEINEKVATSFAASNYTEAREAAEKIGYPVIVRAAFALGGLGSGFASCEAELKKLCDVAFSVSPQVLVERSMKGWKEIEYEVVRDAHDNCITVCNMENFDPLGIHTGDSIVVAPSQTLSDEDYHMLRTTAVRVIRHLGVVGECNIQYALDPFSKEYCIIEVNARLSRSSALASKATGYPLAFVAAKLGLNITLPEITNNVTKSTCACFEPSLDYCVVKIPRWDLKKFTRVSNLLSSSMKSVGEAMSIGRNFEEAIQKAIRSTDFHNLGFSPQEALMSIDIDSELQTPSDQRLFALANAFDVGYTVDQAWELTKIDKWFLRKLKNLVDFGKTIAENYTNSFPGKDVMLKAKQLGFSDRQLASLCQSNELQVRDVRVKMHIMPKVKRIDTVAAEFPATTNYLYLTYGGSCNDVTFEDHGHMVLGSGVYRIGSSVEFDWCAVRAVRTLREAGQKTIMVNYNPETVSTDYDEADRLYFEVINMESCLDIYELEQASGVIVSMGGQASNNIALNLHRQNVNIYGTSPEMIDRAENRFKFSRMLDSIGVDQPEWKELTSIAEAEEFANRVGYPVLVRPSYVLSGAAMNTVYSQTDLESYLNQAVAVSQDYPVVITKYIEGAKEIEMDAVAKSGEMMMHVISEHVENAGVHSGDATLIVPSQDLSRETIDRIVDATAKIGNALNVTGPYNIQFIAKDDQIKVIECNVRASRSFPFVSKVTGVDLIEMATKIMCDLGQVEAYPLTSLPPNYVAIKVPQFSFSRLGGADPVLGVEMASTGEVACFGHNKYEAYLKSLIATGFKLPKKNILLSIGSYKEKAEILPVVKQLEAIGFHFYATAGTSDFLVENGVKAEYLEYLPDSEETPEYSLTEYLMNDKIDLYINLPSANRYRRPASFMSRGYMTRRMAVDHAVPLVTNVKNAKMLFEAMLKCGVKPTTSTGPYESPLIAGSIDSQSSASIFDIPYGFVDTHYSKTSEGPDQALLAGFTQTVVLEASLESEESLAEARNAVSKLKVAGDFLLTPPEGTIMWVPFDETNSLSDLAPKLELASKQSSLVVTDAKNSFLASVLLLSSLHGVRAIHVVNAQSKSDIELVKHARERGLNITIDVALITVFNANLWSLLDSVDALSVGDCTYAEFVKLVTLAAYENKLDLPTIQKMLGTNPRKIFGLPLPLPNTDVELSVVRGVERVELGGTIVALEGALLPNTTVKARDLLAEDLLVSPASSGSAAVASSPSSRNVSRRPSVNTQHRRSFTGERPVQRKREPLDKAHLKEILRNNAFLHKNVVSVHQFNRRQLHELFDLAQEMRLAVERHGGVDLLSGRVLATVFYEPSTRTQSSFDAAMQRLGGRVIPISIANSSVTKGETLQDTLRSLASYCDGIVLRHPEPDSIRTASRFLTVPLLNGGNGPEEHPTQAFLDLFTIREELGTVNNLTITFMGDLKYGRTVHSLVQVLSHWNIKVQLVSPKDLSLPADLRDKLISEGRLKLESEELTPSLLADTDVLYVTRVQKERFPSVEEYERLANVYRVDNSVLAHCKQNACIMHPLPRNNEIAEEVDFDHRAAYFRQMRYGLYVRMALLLMVIGVDF